MRMGMGGNDGVFRGDRRHAHIDAARRLARLRIGIRVLEIDARQRVALLQTLDDNLVRYSTRQG